MKPVFQYSIIVNREWISLLLSFGADLQVLSPDDLRQRMKDEIIALSFTYGMHGLPT